MLADNYDKSRKKILATQREFLVLSITRFLVVMTFWCRVFCRFHCMKKRSPKILKLANFGLTMGLPLNWVNDVIQIHVAKIQFYYDREVVGFLVKPGPFSMTKIRMERTLKFDI